jgi:ABC-type polysaccharide/polyol phosphate export permease
MSLSPTYDVTVTFVNNTIVIRQRLAIYLRIGVMANDASGNVIDRTITDTYNLTIENNRLVAKQTTTTEDHPTMGSVGDFFNFFTNVDEIVKSVNSWLNNFTRIQLTSMPLSVVQDFIFPGGNAFAFKKVMFSDKQDLLAHITYLAPETAGFLKTPRNP